MLLSDGRKIVGKIPENFVDKNVIPIHPNFRIVVLANRPGYPFLGNDFFSEIGDCFSSHTVENPDAQSEIMLLKQYGPGTLSRSGYFLSNSSTDVPEELLVRLTSLFHDLRQLVNEGLLGYPYSLR